MSRVCALMGVVLCSGALGWDVLRACLGRAWGVTTTKRWPAEVAGICKKYRPTKEKQRRAKSATAIHKRPVRYLSQM